MSVLGEHLSSNWDNGLRERALESERPIRKLLQDFRFELIRTEVQQGQWERRAGDRTEHS